MTRLYSLRFTHHSSLLTHHAMRIVLESAHPHQGAHMGSKILNVPYKVRMIPMPI